MGQVSLRTHWRQSGKLTVVVVDGCGGLDEKGKCVESLSWIYVGIVASSF